MDTTSKEKPRTWAKIGLLVGVVTMLAAAHWTGVLSMFGDPVRIKEALLDLGGWGYVVFIVAYALLQPFGVPGTVFVMAAPLIWPWPIAFALSMTGTMAASVVGFSFARFIARDWIAPRVPARFRKYEDALDRRGFATVFTLRFLLWMPPLLHAFFGVSKVRFWTHFWGSLLGYLVPLFMVSFFGQRLFDMITSAPSEVWIGLGVVAALSFGGFYVWRRCRRPGGGEASGQAAEVTPR